MPRIQQKKKATLLFPDLRIPITGSTFTMQRIPATRITIQVSPTHKILLNWEWLLLKPITAIGKVEGVVDLGFGRRAEEFSYNDGDLDQNKNGFISLAAIKQAYISYAAFNQSQVYNG